ncbi:MAG: Holliday junction resolvase RuvX [Myxococcales bacterium]|nr:Holliday junction resolvase RuvX [Myxococcales bacterium]
MSHKSLGQKILAIDLGARRVGLAVTDDDGVVPLPVGTLPDDRKASDRIRRVARLAEARGVGAFIVGLPLESSGAVGESAIAARAFAERLADRSGKPVTLIDERLSTVEAAELIAQGGGRGREAVEARDTISALVLLRAFLDGARGERILPSAARPLPEPSRS